MSKSHNGTPRRQPQNSNRRSSTDDSQDPSSTAPVITGGPRLGRPGSHNS